MALRDDNKVLATRGVTVDPAFSTTSKNAIQNAVVAQEFNKINAVVGDDALPQGASSITAAISQLNDSVVKKSEEVTLISTNWVGSNPATYDLSAYTENDKYDLEVLPRNDWTDAVQKEVVKAQIGSSGNDNLLRCWGTVPVNNIPVVIRKEYKNYGN